MSMVSGLSEDGFDLDINNISQYKPFKITSI